MLIAQIAVLLQSFVDGSFEVRGYVAIEPYGRDRRLVENAIKNCARGATGERQSAGGHLIEHHAKRKKIGAGVEFLSQHLLGRHIRHRTQRRARTGEVLEAGRSRGLGGQFSPIQHPSRRRQLG